MVFTDASLPQSKGLAFKCRSYSTAHSKLTSTYCFRIDLKMNHYDMTPTERLAAKIADLEAKLQLADERAFYLVAQVAQLNAQLGRTDYRTTCGKDLQSNMT